MIRRALSTVFWGFMLVSSMALFPVAVVVWAVTRPFDPGRRALHRLTCFWASLYTWLNPVWSIEIVGRERIRRDETYVMVANHQSLLDILVLFRLFVHFKWVSKAENFRVPFIGWNMSLNRYIKLVRGNRESIELMMTQSREVLAEGNSIMMFPEGTRSLDGRLRPFKPGAFDLALQARRPLLPIVIHGTAHALPKRGYVLQGRHHICIEVLEPIPYARFQRTDSDSLANDVRTLIANRLGQESDDELDAALPRASSSTSST